MAGTTAFKKRSRDDAPRSKASRPSKKQKKLQQYHSDSEDDAADDDGEDFQAVNLLDSDEDLDNAQVDDGASSAPSSSDPEEEEEAPKRKFARDAPASDRDSDADSDSGDSEDDGEGGARRKSKSKRNNPSAFATSLSKILSTKLSSSRRADPVLARSADAHETSRQIVDSALESKARRRLREQKRLAMEKGRVKDVLVATSAAAVNPATGAMEEGQGGGETTAQILETERRLRKVAQRGVVKLFNAVRAAQVKASEAERLARTEGVIGVDRKKEKVTEMSRKGFLDLIASGGGGLKKGKLEEA